MRKRKKGKKFGRVKKQREALLKSLASSLILNRKIKTTEIKAKELRRFVEPLITKAKTGDLHKRRIVRRSLSDPLTKKLFEEIGPLYKDRPGGYTRITKLPPRESDGAKMAVIELI